jgi:D-3-phosphoglycerate dehydrogenase / 2-oxoglutarate reductase
MTDSAATPSRYESGTRPTVVVFDPVPGPSTWGPETAIFGGRGVELIVPEDGAAADEAIRTADAVIVTGFGRLDADRVASLERAVGILCYSIGMDKVDGDAAKAAGIPVRNVPDYCTDEVSDHALALLLAAQRRILPFATATAAGGWPNDDPAITGSLRRLRGQTLGIAGAGRIGRLVAAKARAFGFRTVAFDPFITAAVDPDLPLVDAHELFTGSDAIVVCAAYTPGAAPLISREVLERVKPGLILVNISRGGHIDEHALAEALQDGRVAVAALDVRVVEPPDPADDPLSGLPNVVLTPHVAGSSREAVEDLHRLAAEYVLDLLEAGGRISVAA